MPLFLLFISLFISTKSDFYIRRLPSLPSQALYLADPVNMWWGKGSSDKPEVSKENKTPEAPPSAKVDPRKDATAFDPDKLPERRELPKGMQKIVETADRDDNFFEELAEG